MSHSSPLRCSEQALKPPLKEVRGTSATKRVKALLENKFAANHPGTIVQVGSGFGDNIHVRIISPHFEGMPRSQRDDEIWGILEELPEDDVLHISLCILLSSSEVPKFENIYQEVA